LAVGDSLIRGLARSVVPALALLLVAGAGVASADTTATISYGSPGTYTFTVPAGVTSLQVTAPAPLAARSRPSRRAVRVRP